MTFHICNFAIIVSTSSLLVISDLIIAKMQKTITNYFHMKDPLAAALKKNFPPRCVIIAQFNSVPYRKFYCANRS